MKQQLDILKGNIKSAAEGSPLAVDPVTLIAVSKHQPPPLLEQACQAGIRIFGENRVQEAQEKWPPMLEKYPGIELHMIGPLQTNKVGEAIGLFHAIHSLDREKLARVLKTEMDKQQKYPPLFIQINTGNEAQKSGVLLEKSPDFINYCCRDLALPITGLMCLPPVGENPGPHFACLHKLAKDHGLAHLSMGMSSDYEQAVEFGATHVRLGTALFGPRPAKKSL